VIPRGEDLTLVSIERQVLPSAPRLPRVWYRPARHERENVEKNNLDYLEEFSRGKKKGTIFNVEQIQVATRECEGIRTKLNKVRGVEKPLW
jgi:hypothetical protein